MYWRKERQMKPIEPIVNKMKAVGLTATEIKRLWDDPAVERLVDEILLLREKLNRQ